MRKIFFSKMLISLPISFVLLTSSIAKGESIFDVDYKDADNWTFDNQEEDHQDEFVSKVGILEDACQKNNIILTDKVKNNLIFYINQPALGSPETLKLYDSSVSIKNSQELQKIVWLIDELAQRISRKDKCGMINLADSLIIDQQDDRSKNNEAVIAAFKELYLNALDYSEEHFNSLLWFLESFESPNGVYINQASDGIRVILNYITINYLSTMSLKGKISESQMEDAIVGILEQNKSNYANFIIEVLEKYCNNYELIVRCRKRLGISTNDQQLTLTNSPEKKSANCK